MAPRNCYLSYKCPHYSSGDNKPPNEHVRATVACTKYISDECDMSMHIRLFFGEEIACNIEERKMKRNAFRDSMQEE